MVSSAPECGAMDRILGRAAMGAVLKRVSRGRYRAKLVPSKGSSLWPLLLAGIRSLWQGPVFPRPSALDQRDSSVSAVIESSNVRVTPPNSISHQRLLP